MKTLGTMGLMIVWASVAWAEPILVCERLDGGLSIVHPADPADAERQFARTVATVPELQGRPCQAMVDTDLPTDRAKRYAWRLKQGTVHIDPTLPDPEEPLRQKVDAIRQRLGFTPQEFRDLKDALR